MFWKKNKVIDINVAEAIESLNKSKDYLEGLNTGWELARKILCPVYEGGYSIKALNTAFTNKKIRKDYDVFDKCTAQEVLVSINKYDEEYGSIATGDIVIDGIEQEAIVTNVGKDSRITVMYKDGSSGEFERCDYKKTGIKMDIASFLNKQNNNI